jgi:hypothetical protein
MGISGEASARMTADVTVCPFQRINEAERSFRGIFAGGNSQLPRQRPAWLAHAEQRLWTLPTSARFAHSDLFAQAIKIGAIDGLCRRRRRAGQQKAAQLQAILLFAYELTHVFAARAVTARVDLLINEVIERVRQGDVRRGHDGIMASLENFGKQVARATIQGRV